jgi:hypothetical protein
MKNSFIFLFHCWGWNPGPFPCQAREDFSDFQEVFLGGAQGPEFKPQYHKKLLLSSKYAAIKVLHPSLHWDMNSGPHTC